MEERNQFYLQESRLDLGIRKSFLTAVIVIMDRQVVTHATGCEDGLYIFHSCIGRIHGLLKSCCISMAFRSVCVWGLLAFWFLWFLFLSGLNQKLFSRMVVNFE